MAIVPKLKFEHIYLTSFSKMRVDLATQVHVYNFKVWASHHAHNALIIDSGAQ